MMDWALPHPRWAIHPERFVRIVAGHVKGHKRLPLRGSAAQLKITDSDEVVNEDLPVHTGYRTSDPKAEFVSLVTEHLKAAAGPADVLNRCRQPPGYRAGASTMVS